MESVKKFAERCNTTSSQWWHKSYLIDWIAPVVFVGVTLGITSSIKPFYRYLPANDDMVEYPKIDDIVPDWALAVLWVCVLLIVLAFSAIKRNPHDMHHAVLSMLVTICVVNALTSILKTLGGRYRPNWLSTFAAENSNEGRYSFPSGHSSNAFAAMMWFVLYLYGKFRVYQPRYSVGFGLSFLCSTPLAVAFFIAISRTMDYHHNFDDITAGSLIGILVAYYGYFIYYPPLSDDNCHQPKLHISFKSSEIRAKGERTPPIQQEYYQNPDKVEVSLAVEV